MKNKSFTIIVVSFILFIMNVFVFLTMGKYANEHKTFINTFMIYLTAIIIVGSGISSYVGYRDLTKLSNQKKVFSHIIFWIHLLGLAIFLGTIWSINS